MAHVIFVRPSSRPDGGYDVLLQRRAALPEKRKPCMWGIVGGNKHPAERSLTCHHSICPTNFSLLTLVGSIDPAEREHSRNAKHDAEKAWSARRRAALREAIEEAGGQQIPAPGQQLPPASRAEVPALTGISRRCPPMPPVDRCVRLPPGTMAMVDDPRCVAVLQYRCRCRASRIQNRAPSR